jgi:glycosyltransferase involved in cell wall biosynthesis
MNLALQAEMDGRYAVVPFFTTAARNAFPPRYQLLLDRVFARELVAAELLAQHPGEKCRCEFPVVHSLGNRLVSSDAAERIVGTINLAIIFFEDTYLPDHSVEVAKRFDLILAGSTWNRDVLRKNNVPNVVTYLQGIDPSTFYTVDRRQRKDRPFLIFSGGKLEYRKGQDIVVDAFRRFHRRHPESILVTTWHNHWPKSMTGIDHKGYVCGMPVVNSDGRLEVTPWLEANGIPSGASHNLTAVPNHLMPQVFAQLDVSVFTNRCEGGTNLIAMECLASGLPTILSTNTGHLDLIDERHCYPLTRQGRVDAIPPYVGTDEWGESDVDEVVEALERVYRDRTQAAERGAAAARFMRDWTWRRRFEQLVAYLD